MPKLGVNIDHVATLRQARREFDPDPLAAARLCEIAGADGIVCHLREDRRHIQDRDVVALRRIVTTQLNLEASLNPRIIAFAGKVQPDIVTLVPERRQELTTEGGLDIIKLADRVGKTIAALERKKILSSLFIAPVARQVKRAAELGAAIIELHTGEYAHTRTPAALRKELARIHDMTAYGRGLGLRVSAGHGLDYKNTSAIARVPEIEELNIGHSIVSRAVFVGLEQAVREMKRLANIKP